MNARFLQILIMGAVPLFLSHAAWAQVEDRPTIDINPPEPLVETEPDANTPDDETLIETPSGPQGKLDSVLETIDDGPDYSQMTPEAERVARLDDLFAKLKIETDAEDASLLAEEIWAIWLESGSDSVNFLIRRANNAQTQGDVKLARRMYDHVTTLKPDFAEGWARSGRLAYDQDDLGRAVTESSKALILEPRHFFALWTLGNIFEKLDRYDEALESYREAAKYYPELEALKERLKVLETRIEGDVL